MPLAPTLVEDRLAVRATGPEYLGAADTGYDAVTFTQSWTRGPGLSTFQVLRVGKSVLITHTYGEGRLSESRAQIRRQTRLGRDLAIEMCAFARAGC